MEAGTEIREFKEIITFDEMDLQLVHTVVSTTAKARLKKKRNVKDFYYLET